MASDGKIFRRASDLCDYAAGEDGFVFHRKTTAVFSLNKSAREILDLCDGKRSTLEIARQLAEQYGCEGEDLLPDVHEMLLRMKQAGLVFDAG